MAEGATHLAINDNKCPVCLESKSEELQQLECHPTHSCCKTCFEDMGRRGLTTCPLCRSTVNYQTTSDCKTATVGLDGPVRLPYIYVKQNLAVGKESFQERIKELLDYRIIKTPLTRKNYKNRFQNMICWEEKAHIDNLERKCNGVYNLVIHQTGFRPQWLQSAFSSKTYTRYGYIEGIENEIVAYAKLASEAAFIVTAEGEVSASIMMENSSHTDDNLYIGFTRVSDSMLRRLFHGLADSEKSYSHVTIEFEVKHVYFDNLIKSVNNIDPVIVQKLLPQVDDFLPPSSSFFRYKPNMHSVIAQLDPDDQLTALKKIVSCPAQSPPILINGSSTSGKTRVIALSAYYITVMATEPARVLVCSHHQKSVDTFIESYFGELVTNKEYFWRVRLIRVTPFANYTISSERFSKFYMSFSQLCEEVRSGKLSTHVNCGNLVVVTTYLTALRFQELFGRGFFTHIFLDDGAQIREPEAIAPLSLATSNTKLLIAGDPCQVGPALLVQGEETREGGFTLSLLERLTMEYEKIGGPAKDYLITLSTNYRCHKDIIAIPSQLFYSGLKSKARYAHPHPKAPYPLLFVCSNLTSEVCSPELEAKVILDQANYFVEHWPKNDSSWGDYDLHKISVVTSTHNQLLVTRKIQGTSNYRQLRQIHLISNYEIQGRDFQAIFVSTTEPIDKDGRSYHPTTSPCDHYVFNTILTRTKSLVVMVGSPWVLLNTEAHMAKLSGDKARCWSLYLRSCLENGTLIIPSLVEPNQSISEKFKEQLAYYLGATRPPGDHFSASKVSHSLPLSPLLKDFQPQTHEDASKGKEIPQRTFLSVELSKSVPKLPEMHSQHFTKYKLDVEQLKQPLTRENYVEKFHHLLCWDEQKCDKKLQQRCGGSDVYDVTLFQQGFIPVRCEDHNSVRFGYISCTDGDKLSYAKQASEGSFIILDEHTFIKAKHIFGRISTKDVNSNAIVFGLTSEETSKLVHWTSLAKTTWSRSLRVHFELKHSYFQRLHTALDKISTETIMKIMPSLDNFIDNENGRELYPGKPEHKSLELDSYQQRALRTILNCSPGAPVLVMGPFGTGKTRLLARAAYEILKLPESRVLICSHHQVAVDTFVKILGNIVDSNEMIRIIPSNLYRSPRRSAYPHIFVPKSQIHQHQSIKRLVITTFGILPTFPTKFSHILIDEGAQTREPEMVSPLRFAQKSTRVIIAGDHLQAGPQLFVVSEEAQRYGLATSLLERLHDRYMELGEPAQKHIVSLLTNYRNQSGILMLPSSLFYGSTLQCRTRDKPHPLAAYPLHFVCTSLKQVKSTSESVDEQEALTLLKQVKKFVDKWPKKEWGTKDLTKICVISSSPNQFSLIQRTIFSSKFKELNGIELSKTYDIQGREFRAVFIGTSEITYQRNDPNGHLEGEPKNSTKSVSNRYVFNTVITCAQSLVVAVGNPFLLLHIEKVMKIINEIKAVNCWSVFIRQCMECNTFHFTDKAKKEFGRDEFSSLKEALHNNIFSAEEIILDSHEEVSDSILNAYKRELAKIPECRSTKLTLSQVNELDLAWIMSEAEVEQYPHTPHMADEVNDVEENYEDIYECVLECRNCRMAEAKPLNKKKNIVTINGSQNRIPAFNGDKVRVGVFPNNPVDKCYGKVLDVISRGQKPMFLCSVSQHDPIIFYPIDGVNPGFCNLPRISRDLLKRRDRDAIEVELESRKDVIVFSSSTFCGNIREGKVPPIQQIIPLSVAEDMLFTVAFIQWKKSYRTPLGIVVGAMPKGYTAFSAERLLKMKHGIEYDNEVSNENFTDAKQELNSGSLYDRAFTIDLDNSDSLGNAFSLVKQHSELESPVVGSVELYKLGVHTVNCAKHILPNTDVDRKAKRRGISVYGGKEGKIMQILPSQVQEMLSLKPNEVRDVLSVVAYVKIDSKGITITNVKVEQAQIKSCIKLTYMTAQDVMDAKQVSSLSSEVQMYNSYLSQPSLSKTLQLLYSVAMNMRRKRLKNDSAYSYDLDKPEDSYCWQVHLLVEELMIWANFTVAEKIHKFYPDTALLLRQQGPNEEDLIKFIDQHKTVARFSLALSNFMNGTLLEDTSRMLFIMASSVLCQIREAIASNNMVRLASLLSSDRYHPQIATVHANATSLSPKAEYCCTDKDMDDQTYRHSSLQLDNYTHFTAPLRRYIDIEVQRMLVQLPEITVSKFDCQPKQFSQDYHQVLCRQLNERADNAIHFQLSMSNVELAVKFSFSSGVYEAYIVDNTNDFIELWFPQLELKNLPKTRRVIPLKSLGHSTNKEDLRFTVTKAQTFQWKIQMTSFGAEQGNFVFSIPSLAIQENDKANNLFKGETMSVDMFTVEDSDSDSILQSNVKYVVSRTTPLTTVLSLDQWKKALNFVKEPTPYKMQELGEIFPKLSPVSSVNNPHVKPLSPFINVYYQTCFNPHDVVRVWMTQSMRKALIIPTIQMIEVSPLLRICVQHNSHPAECFSDPNLSQASRKFYNDITEYVHLWEKVLLAEAANKSITGCKQVILHDVLLEWPHLSVPSNCFDEEYYQPTDSIVLTLPTNFLENCSEYILFSEGDLVCARYGTNPNAQVRAVFHMVIHDIQYNEYEDNERQPVKLRMKFIGESNCKISEQIKPVLKSNCELQLISLSTYYQRIYRGLLKLLGDTSMNSRQQPPRQVSELATNIALGNEIITQVPIKSKMAAEEVFRKHIFSRQLWTTPHLWLNAVQEETAKLAFNKPFLLIQGPPGTGKSELGAHIAYTFAMANKQLSPSKCVLYCGSSNKSVDVLLEKLDKLCACPQLNILRIYGRAIETKSFPDACGSGDPKSAYDVPEWAKTYALHYKIREGPFSLKLIELEQKLEEIRYGGKIPNGKVCRQYKKTLVTAEDAVLSEHFDIILCTCNETSSTRISRYVFPRQCIVGDCGMASEPECIIPLELCDHVVLVGDHKQLQPAVDYSPARENGLSTSLLQRYANNFYENHIKTLTIQYRMHEAICEFPSNHFYSGVLETAYSVKLRNNPETKLDQFWPGPKKSRCPILFCNVIGKENDHKNDGIATGEKICTASKFNETEARKVVEIAETLCKFHKVPPKQIAVLTPYMAQKILISDMMKKAMLTIKVTSITESQGDEYGIVILSTVRSLPLNEIADPNHVQADRGWLLENLGFLADEHQLNVGITRSKYGLIIVGNKHLLSYDKDWKALIDHYQKNECIVEGSSFCCRHVPLVEIESTTETGPKLAPKSPYFSEAENNVGIPFLHHQVLECSCKGREYTIEDHDLTLRIPEGAVAEDTLIHFEIGVAMYGPFILPKNTQPISPIVWLCILEENVELKKPFELILPHYLTGLNRARLQGHQIEFSKANHEEVTFQKGQIMYNFNRCKSKVFLASSGSRSYGVIRSTHCCFYCLHGKKTHELAMDSGYCLARIEHLLPPPRNMVYFIAVYFLDTCVQALKEQFPCEKGFETSRFIDFKFKEDEASNLFIKVVPPPNCQQCEIALDPNTAKIRASDIDFWSQPYDFMKLKHDTNMYPPRVIMTVTMRNPDHTVTLPVTFEGCSSDSQLNTDITFPLGHPVSLSASPSSSSLSPPEYRSFAVNAIDNKPKLKDVLKKLIRLASSWKTIGVLLDIEVYKLETIQSDEEGAVNRLRAMLSEWFKMVDPPPNWKNLIDAIKLVDELVAQQIEESLAS